MGLNVARGFIPPAIGRALERVSSYVIQDPGGSPYLKRYLLWGKSALTNAESGIDAAGEGHHSGFVHRIYRPDADRHLHDHPWLWGAAVILKGGYVEERIARNADCPPTLYRLSYGPGDLNLLKPGDYHRIVSVEEETWTLFLCGRVVQDWGFLVPNDDELRSFRKVPHADYLTDPADGPQQARPEYR